MAVLTKSQQVERLIRNAILRGQWAPGQALPAERDLIAKYGVSRATLRHALSYLAHDGLVVAKPGSGTYVAETDRTACIALVIRATQLASLMGPYFHEIIAGFQEMIKAEGYRGVLCVGHGQNADDFLASTHLLEMTKNEDVAGVISLMDLGPLARQMERAGIPTVKMGSHTATHEFCVMFDYPAMVEMARSTLASHGYGDGFSLMYLESLEGDIPELMKQKSQKIVPVRLEAVGGQQERLLPVPWSHDFARAYDVFKDWWQSPARSKAIFFEDECLFAAASRAILELSISVPDELGIISSRSINRPLQFPVPINSIFLDLQKMQQMAWNTLLNLIDGKEIEQRIQYISPELIEGKSL